MWYEFAMKTVWTDGACFPNPGFGSWAFTDLNGVEDKGTEMSTTNNRMEMLAVLRALERFKEEKDLLIISDSQYVVFTLTKNWKKKKNVDLWTPLVKLFKETNARIEWVRGHSGDPGNERADELCLSALPIEAQSALRKFY